MSIAQGSPENNQNGADVWPQVLDVLAGQMTKATFETHFSGSEAVLVDHDKLVIQPRHEKSIDWLKNRWADRIAQAALAVVGHAVVITFSSDFTNGEIFFKTRRHSDRDEIIKPDYVFAATQYFRTHWVPLLGPTLAWVIIALRQESYRHGHAATFVMTYDDLAQIVGCTERTIKGFFAKNKDGSFKNEYIGKFVIGTRTVKAKLNGKLRNLGTEFSIYLTDPLTPDDEAKLPK